MQVMLSKKLLNKNNLVFPLFKFIRFLECKRYKFSKKLVL